MPSARSLRSLLAVALAGSTVAGAAATTSSSSSSTSTDASLTASASATASTSTFLAVPATVTAGVPSTATIAAGTFRSSEKNGDTSSVRALELFLAIGGRDVTSLSANVTTECYLSQDTPLCDLSGITVYSDHIQFEDAHVPFTVPASVGGAGLLYALRIQVLQADGTVYGDALSLNASNEFFLSNTTGRSQLFSTVYAPAAYVPCGSLSCVNDCFLDLFGTNPDFANESTSTAECANKCADIGSVPIPSDWLEVASSASVASTQVQVLSTVPAGTATACFVSGTGSASGAASTGGMSKNAAGGVRELLSKSWMVVAAGAVLAVL
ncbi:hypothetical protein Sste5346_005400 [Sporothrix stenoceras]|uniref:Uncharacterized protein n=1 Tax=Sporothrix stenoceras TaxID=5173 RepID=A0ABR3Z3P2_9PEZI